MNNFYNKINLYDHNAKSYEKIKTVFDSREKVACIIHATGTGKTFNAIALILDNPNKKILFVAPYSGIIEHIESTIKNNSGLDIERDFSNLSFKTYQSFVGMNSEELASLDFDLLILDEFHHIGAPVWGERINEIVETHPDSQIFGMTAYPIRDRGTAYERDMTLQESEELFAGKVVSSYDLCDAFIDGVLPKPIYRSAYVNFKGLVEYLDGKIKSYRISSEKKKYAEMLKEAKRRINEAGNIKDVVINNIRPNGKYIYFCPPVSSEGVSDINTIMAEAMEWFKEIVPTENIVFYKTTSDDGQEGKRNRDAFYNDVTLNGDDAKNKLQVMFAINQYNEGIHAPNIDGVIMGRNTSSDIVFFEQLGRALSVGADNKNKMEEYQKKTYDELLEIAREKHLNFKMPISKEKLIELLVAPVIIDLTDNYEFIKELEDRLKTRIREIRKNNQSENLREIQIGDEIFDIDVINHDIFEMLGYLKERLTKFSWDDWYKLAKSFYRKHGHLNIPCNFKTLNGYEEDINGFKLGLWIQRQRNSYRLSFLKKEEITYSYTPLTDLQIEKLRKIGMIFNVNNEYWEHMFSLAQSYYVIYKNLSVKAKFRTLNGYDYDVNGYSLGEWIKRQRKNYQVQISNQNARKILSESQIERLKSIGMIFENINHHSWNKMYELAKDFYNKHQHLSIPVDYKTEDGVTLGAWIHTQRKNYLKRKNDPNAKNPLSDERINRLLEIGMVFNVYDENWNKMYELAKAFYKHYGHLKIKALFSTTNGIDYDPNGYKLGSWICEQRECYFAGDKNNDKKTKRKPISDEKIKKLLEIGMIFHYKTYCWEEMYSLAQNYFQKFNHLNIPVTFITTNGIDYDSEGEKLGLWINRQRKAYSNRINGKSGKNTLAPLSDEQILRLTKIGMIFEVRKNNKDVEELCIKNGINYKKFQKILKRLSYQEIYAKIEFLKTQNIPLTDGEHIHEIFSMSSINMKAIYDLDLKTLIETYYIEVKELVL